MPPPPPHITPPQHPEAAKPCCLTCHKVDGRTTAGALFCHDCLEEQAVPKPLHVAQ